MKAAITSIARDLALATGRERSIPRTWPVLHAVSGPWDRVCDETGWLEAIRLCANDADIQQLLAEATRHVATDVRAVIKAHAADEASSDTAQPTLFPLGSIDAPNAAHASRAASTAAPAPHPATPAYISIGDHFSSEASWVLDPEFVRAHIVPLFVKVTAAAHAYAARIDAPAPLLIIHSEGDFSDIFPDLAAAGIHGVHLSGLDYSELGRLARAATATKLTPYGGVNAASLAAPGLADDSCRTIARAVHSDGLIPADDGGITAPAELDALIDGLARVALY